MPTIDTKQDALTRIEYLTDKLRRKLLPVGELAMRGFELQYDAASAWNGVAPAPQQVSDFATYKDITNLQAQAILINRKTTIEQLFIDSDRLKYVAKKEIKALSGSATPAEVRVLYNKHLAIFAAATQA